MDLSREMNKPLFITTGGEFLTPRQARALMVVEALIEESPTMRTLEKNKVEMDPEERKQAMKAGAVWHFSSNKGKPSCAIWKSVVKGVTWYGCNTHRYAQARRTLKAAIRAFHDVVEPTA